MASKSRPMKILSEFRICSNMILIVITMALMVETGSSFSMSLPRMRRSLDWLPEDSYSIQDNNNNRIQNMPKTWEEFMRPTNQIVDRENSSPYVVYYQPEPREYRRKQSSSQIEAQDLLHKPFIKPSKSR